MMVCKEGEVGHASKEYFALDDGPCYCKQFQFYDCVSRLSV